MRVVTAAALALASACSAPDRSGSADPGGEAAPGGAGAPPVAGGQPGASPNAPGATLAGAMAHLARGETEEATSQLRRLRDAHPEDPYGHFYLGRALHLDTKLGEAEAAYEAAIDRAPGLAEAWGYLYAIFMEQGRHEEALAALEAVQQKQGAGPRLAYQKGYVLSKMGRYDEADRWFNASLAAQPGHADAWYGLGVNAVRRGDDRMAVEAFRRVLQVDATYSDAWFNLGNALARLGREPEAVEALARFEAVNAKRERDKATQARLNALRTGAEVDLGAGRIHEAGRQIEAAEREAGAQPWTIRMKGSILIREGRLSEAREVLRAAAALDPPDIVERLALAEALREAGDEAAAAAVEAAAQERLAAGEQRP
jgi:tetratricopeptide (TPR) repeat protein